MDTDQVIKLCQKDLEFDLVRGVGPGGQNVNKVSSAVQLRFDILNSPLLSEQTKNRLIKLAGRRITRGGILVIEARRHRTQIQNREEAIERFSTLLTKALEKPKLRKATKPGAASKERRLHKKKLKSDIKRLRQNISHN